MNSLLNFLNTGVSPYHVVTNCKKELEENGFQQLTIGEKWDIKPNRRYYLSPYPSMLFAVSTGSLNKEKAKLRLAMAHTDQPTVKIKPNPQMQKKKYIQLNVEKYGGPILNTWLDRPLGVAGKVVVASENAFEPKVHFFDSKRAILVIPNLAIHMNRDVNKGVELNPQTHMLPMFSLAKEQMEEDSFLAYLAKELQIEKDDILDYDLYAYNYEKGQTVGLQEEFLLAPRIDNLASVYALLEGIKESKTEDFSVVAMFDHEEIGSRTKQGADSLLLTSTIERMLQCAGFDKEDVMKLVMNGFMLSVDGAHGYHPNYGEKSDPTTVTQLGDGIVIKQSGTARYLSDSEATGILMQLCKQSGVSYQRQINRSDILGGQTLGPIANAYLPMMGADLGIPMLGMHSAMETAACDDCAELVRFVKIFFQA